MTDSEGESGSPPSGLFVGASIELFALLIVSEVSERILKLAFMERGTGLPSPSGVHAAGARA